LRRAAARVRAAFLAEAERAAALRFLAADRACLARLEREAAWCPSRCKASSVARERRRLTGADPRPAADLPRRRSAAALVRVRLDAVPFLGAGSFTPARRAFDRPIAIACLVDRAPC